MGQSDEEIAAVRSHRLVKTDALQVYIDGAMIKAFKCEVCDVIVLRHKQRWLSEIPDQTTMKAISPIPSCSEVKMENALT